MATADSLTQEAADAYQDAKNLAENALTATDQALQEASQAVTGLGLDWAVTAVPIPSVTLNDSELAVPGYIPTSDFSQDVATAFNERFAQLNNDLRPQIEEYLEAFFPDIAEAVKTSSDEWIVSTILNGEYVPVEVENALWNRARDREVQDAQRTEESIVNASAARGFSLPDGVMTYTIAVNQQETQKRLSTISRDIALKAFDVMDANTKFAIQMAVSLRTSFVGALGNFINLAMQQPNQANDYARLILQSKTALHDAALNLYRSKMDEEKLRSTVGFGNADMYPKYADVFINGRSKLTAAEINIAEVQAGTAIKAADTLARVAGSAFATRNSMVSISASV